jgi:hypothetical protein
MSFSHGRADAKHRRCSGLARTPAAERLDGRISGGGSRSLHPQIAMPEATGFRAASFPRSPHASSNEHHDVH